MSTSLEIVEAEALKLAPAERSQLVERLLASLDDDAEVEAAWDALASEREAAIGSASAQAVPLNEAFARLQARFAG